ncbi:MAG: N-acetyl-gamma-glutamyl-phosphate reductase [Clostridia bacterium]|nr:N-acetyl-gamma-glutamyl-phosphate reductase [Clostridia bacterium]
MYRNVGRTIPVKIRAAIVGANGYTGFELIKLLCNHPHFMLTAAASRSFAGTRLRDVYPALSFVCGNDVFVPPDADEIAKKADVVFTALPHAASAAIGGTFHDKGIKVIDLSADFRYTDINLYETTYGVTHPRPELNRRAVYGLCEIFRAHIAKADIVGNPGCYTTCSILPLYPLLQAGLLSPHGIIVDAASGITGAGRKESVDYNFCETDENYKAYGVTTHRHTTEIEEKLHATVTFTPHLLPVKRGILATIYADLAPQATAAAIDKAYGMYADEKFAVPLGEGVLPELKWVAGSNVCAFGYKIDHKSNRIIIVSAIDNLIKGASGQAVQNANILFGLPETEGLPAIGNHL